jgi:WXG100 family type VII secretion target
MSTASKVRADYQQLAQIAGVFGQQAETALALLAALKEQVQGLQEGDWVGKSADTFYGEMHAAVLPTVSRLADAMREAAQATQKISQVMKQAEEDAAALFRLEASAAAGSGSASTAVPAGPMAALFRLEASAAAGSGSASTAVPAGPMAAAFAGGGPGGGSGGAGGGSPAGAAGGSPATAQEERNREGGAVDTRAEKVQRLLDQARHEQEMLEDTVREKAIRKARYDEAVRQNKGEREILRLKAELRSMENAEKFYKEDMIAKYNEAIRLAARLYKIDLSAVKGTPDYDHNMKLGGYTDWDRVVTISQDGVGRSPGWLASTLGHEALHAKQMKEGRAYDESENLQGAVMNDIECFQWELDNAQRNGLTQAEIDSLKGLLKREFDKLEPANKDRVNRGNYAPVDTSRK